uniref:U82-Liphistoxin-Lth1a_1 n=2 Tax=Liphistius TaxID=62150 RepID=A0A4Q8K5M7_9ARAC
MRRFALAAAVVILQLELVLMQFDCDGKSGFHPDPVQCDKYYECRDGEANPRLCKDGLVFLANNPLYERCDFPFAVHCGSRTELQPATSSANCPRKYGLFPHSVATNCKTFWQCNDGVASKMSCQTGLAFNPATGTCQWKYLVPKCQAQ